MTEASSKQGPRRILLVGHCGPDGTYLRSAIRSALGEVQIVMVEDSAQLQQALSEGADLVLFNRELGYGFDPAGGVEMISTLHQQNPALRMMLVSNYPDAQAAAVAAGAFAGFGKRQIGTPRVTQVLRDAVSQAKS
jgi:DNA-binding NarL/FixJ family response regulator